MPSADQILALIGQYGYLLVFFGVMLESAGVPLPGETILLASGALVQQGYLDLGHAIVFGILGAMIGDQIGYWVGRGGGRPFVLRWGRYVLVTPTRLERAEEFFERHGGKAVFLARFVLGLRVFGALVAGISRMRWRPFLFYNALGGAAWATAAVMVGYLLGGSLDLVEQWMGRAAALLGLLLALALVFYLSYWWVASHRKRIVAGWGTFLSYPPVARLRARYERQLRWLRRRLTPGQYLGLHLTMGLLTTAGCLWLFGRLAEDILANDPLVRFDAAVAGALHGTATPALTTFFLGIAGLGSITAVELLCLFVAVGLSWRRRWLLLGTWLAAVTGGVLLNQLLKELFARPRPVLENPLLLKVSYGFPSGHAMEALVVYGMLAYLAVHAFTVSWRARTAAVFGATLLVLLVGFSQLYFGVLYFSDVVAGFAAGGAWLSICITAVETVRRGKDLPERSSPPESSGRSGRIVKVRNALRSFRKSPSQQVPGPRKRRWGRRVLVPVMVAMLASVGVGAFAGYDYCTYKAGEDTLSGCATDTAVNTYRTLWGSPTNASADVTSKGTVETKTFYSEALGQTMDYVVYLPPGYEEPQNSTTRYPVVYLLPGVSGSTDTWVKAGDMANQMDTLLADGRVQPMILVVPQESLESSATSSNGGYVDGPSGDWGTYTTRDVVNEVDSSYRTVQSKDGRAIAGDSEGGYGAINLGLKNPSEYGVIGSFSGYFTPDEDDLSSIFGRDQDLAYTNSPALYLPQLGGELPAIYLLVGQDDYYLAENQEFAGELEARGASYELNTPPGGHNWDFWRAQLPDLLTFTSEHLEGEK